MKTNSKVILLTSVLVQLSSKFYFTDCLFLILLSSMNFRKATCMCTTYFLLNNSLNCFLQSYYKRSNIFVSLWFSLYIKITLVENSFGPSVQFNCIQTSSTLQCTKAYLKYLIDYQTTIVCSIDIIKMLWKLYACRDL